MTDPLYQPLKTSEISWQNGQPFSIQYNDAYSSIKDGLAEANCVFIEGNNLIERWQKLSDKNFYIGETGFGAGLNFLTALSHWNRGDQTGTLHFISAEQRPLTPNDLTKILATWPSLKPYSDCLINRYPPPIPGIHRLNFPQYRATLTLLYGDADKLFKSLHTNDNQTFIDAWFLDGFSPVKTPQMWTDALFTALANLSTKGTSFSTYAAVSTVKKGLKNAGFNLEVKPGFANKRERLTGKYIAAKNSLPEKPVAPWFTPKSDHPATKTAAVIGAGIAGCSTAFALANRGIKTTVIDRHTNVAAEASGNPQAIIYPKLSLKMGHLSRFSLAALCYGLDYYRSFWSSVHEGKFGQQSGLVLLPETIKQRQDYSQIAALYPAELVREISGEQLLQTTGINLACEKALYFPQAGWINPTQICQQLIDHPLIEFIQGDVDSLHQEDQCWQLLDKKNNRLTSADTLIVASGTASNNFEQTRHLPLNPVGGQISVSPASPASQPLKTVICGRGYLAPPWRNNHTLGATYQLNSSEISVSDNGHNTNLEQLKAMDQGLAKIFKKTDITSFSGRAALRCTTPDYLPIAGIAPVKEDFLEDYSALRRDARTRIETPGSYYPQLYINCGHGSRGMTYAPFCAEIIANKIAGELPSLSQDILQSIHPARFLIRDLKRNKSTL